MIIHFVKQLQGSEKEYTSFFISVRIDCWWANWF